MDFLPLFHNLQGRNVLLVGGGAVALRKARLLLASGAHLHVIAPTINSELITLIEQHKGSYALANYQITDIKNHVLVVAATDDMIINQQVSTDAQALNIPVNVVDNPRLSTVIFPAIVDRSPIIVAVSSSGSSPVLTRLLRAKLETLLPSSYAKLAKLAEKFREKVKQHFSHSEQRRIFWEKVLQSPIAEQVLAGREQQAEQQLQQLLENANDQAVQGEVYLIGAGPGDPDLLTFRALRLMQQADVVLYDRLVSPTIIDLCRRDADRIYVGKQRSNHSVPQENINQLLVNLAKQGKRVVRLKGGDPFIFGRGGEEIATLADHNIPFQVVPGITAASGCAAYAGIPLTHRDYAQSVRFVTGHLKDNTIDLPWQELVAKEQTVVFYMGLVGLSTICQQLINHGQSPDAPIALIEQGTTEAQRVFTGTLATLPQQIANQQVHAPTLIIVGDVVKLRDKLAWFK
ncbi:siroheme synthase CysG [Entomomonas asaccharolytica]|uniref:Siroheme synthase n=1 Tax=Entomomonas asaccharolytica TaxID=2785331 RepID=A0A974ND18_9GAMM|nr:siroheme synthase CysG [Entomomonas asaccharolytica]QQP84370.1 uroporphyrinogen-III C-methyltransferase [Entomomonas asaccharolytica]